MPFTLLRHRCDVQYADDSWVTVMGLKELQRTCGFSQWNHVIAVRTATHVCIVWQNQNQLQSLCRSCALYSDKLMLESVFVCLQAIVLFNTRYCSYIAPCGTVFEPKVSTVWQPNERYQSHSVALRGSEVNDDL